MKDIAIYGAGGFGKEVACLINRINEKDPSWNLIGFFDDNPAKKGQMVSHFAPCLGGIDGGDRMGRSCSYFTWSKAIFHQ